MSKANYYMNHKQRTENWNSTRFKAGGILCLISLKLFSWSLFLINKVYTSILYCFFQIENEKSHTVMGAFFVFWEIERSFQKSDFLRNMSKWIKCAFPRLISVIFVYALCNCRVLFLFIPSTQCMNFECRDLNSEWLYTDTKCICNMYNVYLISNVCISYICFCMC